jgi:uncharacterized membrane protein YqhA
MSRLISLSRYVVVVPVLASLLGAGVLMVYGGVQVVVETVRSLELMVTGSEKGIKKESVAFIELVDLSLLATVLYVIGVGLYELFVGRVELPEWLVIKILDDLKVKLISVVVTVLAVLFLGQVVSWDGKTDLLPLGAAIALVIAALTFFLARHGSGKADKADKPEKAPHDGAGH